MAPGPSFKDAAAKYSFQCAHRQPTPLGLAPRPPPYSPRRRGRLSVLIQDEAEGAFPDTQSWLRPKEVVWFFAL